MGTAAGLVRIGELSRRSGASPELLRAWERRYGLLAPVRTAGGFRLYSADDERRVAVMRAYLQQGLSAAEASRLALADDRSARDDGTSTLANATGQLADALAEFDESAAHAALDRLLGSFALETVLGTVVLPYLRDLGEGWERGEVSIAQEHFASNLLRGRLLGLARGWDGGAGPRALLACPPGEQHDLALIVFGLCLRRRGWRVTYFGADTPLSTLEDAATRLDPEAVVLAATVEAPFASERATLRRLARLAALWLAGAGATSRVARGTGARRLDLDPLAAADTVASGPQPGA